MASELPPEQHASYSALIDQILASSDLNTISAKRIRKQLQEKLDYDITPQKTPITDLIMVRFDALQRKHANGEAATTPEPAPTTNGDVDHAPKTEEPHDQTTPPSPTSPTKRKAPPLSSSEEISDIATTPPPPKKVKKAVKTETDEELAMRMQAELNAPSARSTRRGGAASTKKKTQVVKKSKTPKKKSKAKVGSDEDSDIDDEDEAGEKKEKERKGGFHKSLTLSPPLASLLGSKALSRPQTVKRIWAYVKQRDLQDPADKRQIRCDDAMRAVFRQERVHMFTMNKLLAGHLWDGEGGDE